MFIWYKIFENSDTNALYTVHHSEGQGSHYIDQTNNEGDWVSLGTYNFDTGTSGYVEVERHAGSTGTSTSAGAVMFVLSEGDTTPCTTDYDEDGDIGGADLCEAIRNFCDCCLNEMADSFGKLT